MGWLKAKDQTILALHKRVITHNARIDVDHEEDRSVGRLAALNELRLGMGRLYRTNESMILTSNDRRIWQLKIRQVQESDRGCYMCQINTEEMKKQIGCIDVLSESDAPFSDPAQKRRRLRELAKSLCLAARTVSRNYPIELSLS